MRRFDKFFECIPFHRTQTEYFADPLLNEPQGVLLEAGSLAVQVGEDVAETAQNLKQLELGKLCSDESGSGYAPPTFSEVSIRTGFPLLIFFAVFSLVGSGWCSEKVMSRGSGLFFSRICCVAPQRRRRR